MFQKFRAGTIACAALFLSFPTVDAGAQAVQTADQHVRVKFYGAVSFVRPAFLSSPRAVGFTFGGNLDGIRVLPYVDVGLDVRGATSHSDRINELSAAGGPRISYARYRLQPYAEYMLGLGRGTFNHPSSPDYVRDYTAIRSYGGGFDYRVTKSFSLRADVQQQRWRFTQKSPYFYPLLASVGVSYQLHPRSRYGPQ